MASYVISTDTSCDFPLDYVQRHQIPLVSLYYSIDGKDGVNGCPKSEELKTFYQKMREGAACLAAETLREEFPDRKIIVIDSLCASLGQGLLVDYALRMKDEGKSMEETAQWVQDHLQNICHLFTVDDLKYLQRGGRISKTTALLGTMIGIKPVLHVDEEGKLVPLSKVRGRKQSIQALVDKMEQNIGSYRSQKQPIFISHGDCEEDAKYLAGLVKERFGYDECLINIIGPTIGAHAGPGTLALFFLGEVR